MLQYSAQERLVWLSVKWTDDAIESRGAGVSQCMENTTRTIQSGNTVLAQRIVTRLRVVGGLLQGNERGAGDKRVCMQRA